MENGRGDNNYYNSIIIMLHNKDKNMLQILFVKVIITIHLAEKKLQH